MADDKLSRDLFGHPVFTPPRQLGLGLSVSVGTVSLSHPSFRPALSGLSAGGSTGLASVEIPEAELGARWARTLRCQHPANTAKLVARDLACELRTAEGWLTGQAPQLKFFFRAMRRYGSRFVAAMADPGSAFALAVDLDAQASEVEARLAKLAASIQSMRGER